MGNTKTHKNIPVVVGLTNTIFSKLSVSIIEKSSKLADCLKK